MKSIFYYRNGCHLCEELVAVIHRGWPDQLDRMIWRDVDQKEEWRLAYGIRVPVLLVDDREVSALQPDIARLREYFGPEQNPL